MCDYSLHLVATRPAKVGDKLVSTTFVNALTRGFAAVGEPNVAVCLSPGTEVAFENDVEYRTFFSVPPRKLGQRVARFRKVNEHEPKAHHDALEFPDGQIVILNRLCEGQCATVLQLPVAPYSATKANEQASISERRGLLAIPTSLT
jgi:hypothetical protein